MAAICSASGRARPMPSTIWPPRSMAARSRTEPMVDQSITGAAGKVAEGDRSGRARLVIVLLCVALALSMFLSLRSGASDASAVAVIRDWLTGTMPDDAALGARDRLIVYDI